MVVGGNLRTLKEGKRERRGEEHSRTMDQNDARGIRDGLIKRFIPNSKLINSFMIYLFYRD